MTIGPPITPGELALAIAMGEVGVQEDEGRPNRGKRVDMYIRAAGLDPDDGSYPWCACFVSWAVREAQLRYGPLRFRGSASVARLLEKNRALAVVLPKPGDVFVHLNEDGTGHTGFVTAANTDGSLATLEGNSNQAGSRTGGQVVHGNRPAHYADAFLRVG